MERNRQTMGNDAQVDIVKAEFLGVSHGDFNSLGGVAGEEEGTGCAVLGPIGVGVLPDGDVPVWAG